MIIIHRELNNPLQESPILFMKPGTALVNLNLEVPLQLPQGRGSCHHEKAMTIPHVSHVEWHVADLTRAEAFLSGLFGWHFEPYSRHYRLYTPPEGGTCVGLMEVRDARPCRSTLVHVQVNDIEAYLRRAVELGGRIDSPKTEIPHYGWYAHVLDPDGNVVGLFQALS